MKSLMCDTAAVAKAARAHDARIEGLARAVQNQHEALTKSCTVRKKTAALFLHSHEHAGSEPPTPEENPPPSEPFPLRPCCFVQAFADALNMQTPLGVWNPRPEL